MPSLCCGLCMPTSWCPKPTCGNVMLARNHDQPMVVCNRPRARTVLSKWRVDSLIDDRASGRRIVCVCVCVYMQVCSNKQCNFTYCKQCNREWHADMTCEQYTHWLGEASFEKWVRDHAKPCPRCHANIEVRTRVFAY